MLCPIAVIIGSPIKGGIDGYASAGAMGCAGTSLESLLSRGEHSSARFIEDLQEILTGYGIGCKLSSGDIY